MNFKIGNFLDQEANIYIFPANGQLNTKGELIMGAGAAKAVKEKHPSTPRWFGERIHHLCHEWMDSHAINDNGEDAYLYYVSSFACTTDKKFFALQTKLFWRNPSTMNLVTDSLAILRNTLIEKPYNWTFSMAYPGIGKGGLKKEEVEPLLYQYLDIFGDRLTVWSLE